MLAALQVQGLLYEMSTVGKKTPMITLAVPIIHCETAGLDYFWRG